VRANIRSVLEQVTLADLVSGELPKPVEELTAEPDAWAAR
jgi:DNA-binding IscR family transcriptional regulator